MVKALLSRGMRLVSSKLQRILSRATCRRCSGWLEEHCPILDAVDWVSSAASKLAYWLEDMEYVIRLVPPYVVACASYVTEYWPDHVPAVRLRREVGKGSCSQFGCVAACSAAAL